MGMVLPFLGYSFVPFVTRPAASISLKPNLNGSHLKEKSKGDAMTDLRYPIGKFKYEGPPTKIRSRNI